MTLVDEVIDLFYEFDSRFVIAQDSGKAERQQPRYKRITRETFFGDRDSESPFVFVSFGDWISFLWHLKIK